MEMHNCALLQMFPAAVSMFRQECETWAAVPADQARKRLDLQGRAHNDE